jgi:hypothetical protein
MSGAIAYARGIIPDAINREPNDFYPTPPAATRALLAVEKFDGWIWEPACGDGAMSTVLLEAGYTVYSTDLINRNYGVPNHDFLADKSKAPNIVTNPPFKIAQQFVEHALACATGKVAMLCRLGWLEGIERNRLFKTTPLARVWVFSNRIPMARSGTDFGKGGGGMIAFAWYVWDHTHDGPPTLGWLLSDKIARAPRSKAACNMSEFW